MMSNRTAEYSIKGYIYQFLRYLDELLGSEAGHKVVIEGAIEDIDVIGPTWQKAVQCKYHETSETFTLGKVYKPILLMMEHFAETPSPTVPIDYHLYCHFPGYSGTKVLTSSDLDAVRATTDKTLKKIADRIKPFDSMAFLARLTLTFGLSFKEMENAVLEKLVGQGLEPDDVKAIFYPAAFQKVADTSINKTVADRTLEKTEFVKYLKQIKFVTLTRWTRELATQKDIFKKLRSNIGTLMAANSSRRHFYIDASRINDFDLNFSQFAKRFVDKYAFKYLHIHAPVFVIERGAERINSILEALYAMGIVSNEGRVGTTLKPDRFFRSPVVKRMKEGPAQREFALSICAREELTGLAVSPADTTFFVSCEPTTLTSNSSVLKMDVNTISQLEYLFKLREYYE